MRSTLRYLWFLLCPFGRPLFDKIPESRSLLDQCRAPYPALAVPPDELLRDLRAKRETKALLDPDVLPRPTTKDLVVFDNAYLLLKCRNAMEFLSALLHQVRPRIRWKYLLLT